MKDRQLRRVADQVDLLDLNSHHTQSGTCRDVSEQLVRASGMEQLDPVIEQRRRHFDAAPAPPFEQPRQPYNDRVDGTQGRQAESRVGNAIEKPESDDNEENVRSRSRICSVR